MPRAIPLPDFGAHRSVGAEEWPDPLIARVAGWIAARDVADTVMHDWQRLETELFRKHGAMSPREASRRGHEEGDQMRLLDVRYKALSRRLCREADRLAGARPLTPSGALAKIEMGLRIQQPLDREDCAWVLVSSGFTELRRLVRGQARAGGASAQWPSAVG